jgi:hypothetical protein
MYNIIVSVCTVNLYIPDSLVNSKVPGDTGTLGVIWSPTIGLAAYIIY